MHSVPRLFGRWSLLVALTLHFGIQSVYAQPSLLPRSGPEGAPGAPVIELAVGMSRPWQMVSHADLKRVENPNSRVVRVERIADRNNEILLVAENPGRTQITFVDQNDRVEVHDIIVTGAVQEQGEIRTLIIAKDASKTVELAKVPLGGVQVTTGRIVEVSQALDNPKVITLKGVAAGRTLVTFFADKEKKTVLAAYDVTVEGIDKVSQLREIIRRITPTAAVNVIPVQKSEDGGDVKSVILTGTVTNIQDALTIEQAAQPLFPRTVGLGGAGAGGGGGAGGGAGGGNMSGSSSARGGSAATLNPNVINQIRVAGVHQVQLEVVVAIVNRTEARNMAFSFAHNGSNWFLASLFGQGVFANAISAAPDAMKSSLNSTGVNLPFGVVSNKNAFMGFLQALRSEDLVKVIAEPRVVTLSGRPANILSGGEVPLLTSSGIGGPTISYKQFGTVVNALPIVMGNNKIYLEIKAEISNKDDTLGITIPGTTPTLVTGFRSRSAQVAIQIEDGQTVAIGGLIQNDINAKIDRVPFLGDLPFLGVAFTQKKYEEVEQELVILVTPRLIDPVDCTRIPKYLPGRETRSPDDFELFLEGIMEAPRGPRNVIFHPHYYRGAHTNSPNAGQIPCGDGGCYNGGAGCSNGNCAPSYNMLGSSRGMDSTMSNMGSPNSQAGFEPNLPSTIPPMRETQPPTMPTLAPRELQNRPLLPPINR